MDWETERETDNEGENGHYLVERRSPCLAGVVVASFAKAVWRASKLDVVIKLVNSPPLPFVISCSGKQTGDDIEE